MSETEIYLLKDAEAKYRGMFENAVEGIYQSTPEGHYLAVNSALARMCGGTISVRYDCRARP